MAFTDSVGGVISGLLNQGGISAPDLSVLFNTIRGAGANQRQLIDALPASLKPLYDQYVASTNAAGTNLTSGVSNVGTALQTGTAANFSPDVAKAAEDAAKTAIFANVPGQQDAIREALAATGGLQRGTASAQLAAPVIQAGRLVGQNIANVTAQQLQAKQAATQQALTQIASMSDAALTSLFGMNREQATAILQGNRQDLKDQLTSLINQSNNETNQLLGVQGANITNQYNQAVADKAQRDALNNAIVGAGVSGVSALSSNPGFLSALGIGPSTGYAPPSYAPQTETQLP